MATRYLISFLLLLAAFRVSATRTVLCGHFNYFPAPTLSIQYYNSPIDFIERVNTHYETEVDGAFNFKLVFDIDHPVCINMQNGKNWVFINMFINPGDSLWFGLDKNSIDIEGRGEKGIAAMFGHESKFLAGHALDSLHESMQLAPMDFAKYTVGRRDNELAFYDNAFKNAQPKMKVPGKNDAAQIVATYDQGIADEYMDAVRKEVIYDAAVNIIQYPFRGKYGYRNLLADTAYLNYLAGLRTDDKDALCIGKYVHFLRELPQNFWECGNDKKAFDSASRAYNLHNQFRLRDSIAKIYFTGETYDVALYTIIYDEVRMLGMSKGSQEFDASYRRTDSSISELGPGFNDKTYLARLKMKLAALKDEDKLAPDFFAYTPEGRKVSLSDYRGKVVYADFWATSCGPCVAEVPYNLKLQEKYKGKDVVFLYVSFDGSLEYLNRFLEDRKFTGTHLVERKGFGSEAAQRYNIAGIPRYILVDKKGLLLSADAPRPSSHPEEIIDKALERN